MLFFEVFVLKGALTAARRGCIGERLVAAVVDAGDAPLAAQQTARAMRAMSWVAFHELDTWFVGERPVEPGEAPRYLVRVTVTAGALSDAKRAHLVERVTHVLAEVDDRPRRKYGSPDAWVHLVEVPDGSWGALGRVMGFAKRAGPAFAGPAEHSVFRLPQPVYRKRYTPLSRSEASTYF